MSIAATLTALLLFFRRDIPARYDVGALRAPGEAIRDRATFRAGWVVLADPEDLTGREADARALYKRVLERRDIAMDLPSGAVASSHDLARRALGVAPVQIATR